MTINDYSVKITVKQPKLDVSGAEVYTPEQSATIHFGRFIKGDKGEPGKDAPKLVRTEFDHKDADGGNVYRQTYSDGSTQLFTAPKGTDGVPATINGRNAITIEQGDNITIQDTRDGIRINATAQPQEQADWNESDQSSKSYIKNRICYEEYGTLLEQDVALDEFPAEDIPEHYYSKLASGGIDTLNIIGGSQYRLNIGGNSFSAVAKRTADYGFEDGPDFIGNINILTTIFGFPTPELDTGEQYIVVSLDGNGYILAVVDDLVPSGGELSLKIEGPTLKKIDRKWLPDMEQSDWQESDESKPTYIRNKPNFANVAFTGAFSSLSGTEVTHPYYVTFTESGGSINSDKSIGDIFIAIQLGRLVVAKYGTYEGTIYSTDNSTYIIFAWEFHGIALEMTEYGVGKYDITTPTEWAKVKNKPTKLSDFENDEGFITPTYHDAAKQDTITDLETIRSNAESGVTASAEAKGIAERAEVIARGRATGYVFDTLAEMNAWLAVPDNVAKLNRGDNLYIIDTNVPDYWWDGTSVQTLETEHPDLSGYVKKTDKASSSSLGLVTAQSFFGLGVLFDGTLYCLMPTNAEIVAKSSMYKPITPYNLDYAVKVGLTTNKLSLTDDEKTIVQNWIGIVPITAVSQLENDAQYATKTYVDNLFNSITHAEDYEY